LITSVNLAKKGGYSKQIERHLNAFLQVIRI
jgi:hypothetical protein